MSGTLVAILSKRVGRFRIGKDGQIADADGNSHMSAEDYAVTMVDESGMPVHYISKA